MIYSPFEWAEILARIPLFRREFCYFSIISHTVELQVLLFSLY